MKLPCKKDCARRSETCHAECRLYRLYCYAVAKERDRRLQEGEIRFVCDAGLRRLRSIRERENRRRIK